MTTYLPPELPQATPAVQVNMFWAYGALSKLERICISSFLSYGYPLNLWTYDSIPNVPSRVSVRDAREILPESRVFLNRAGSYASFADLFRYVLLNRYGGLYADTDVIANCRILRDEKPFLVSERQKGASGVAVNCNVIFNPKPQRGNIIDLAAQIADRFPVEKITWNELGPRLLTSLVLLQAEHGYEIRPPEFANPIDYWECPTALLTPAFKPLENSAFIHCYNDTWRRHGIDKNQPYPTGSLMQLFEQRFMPAPTSNAMLSS